MKNKGNVGNLISDSCIFSKSSLKIWKFTVHVLLKPGLENFEHYFELLLELLLITPCEGRNNLNFSFL